MAREPELAVTCDAPQFVSAEFVERPGLDTLDLVTDLGAFRFRCPRSQVALGNAIVPEAVLPQPDSSPCSGPSPALRA